MRSFRAVETRPNGLPPIQITYNGFCTYRGGPKEHIAIVSCEDGISIWELDGPECGADIKQSLSQLVSFYDRQGWLYNKPLIYQKLDLPEK